MKKSKSKTKKRAQSENSDNAAIQFTEDKIQAMKNMAAQIAKSLSQTQKKTTAQLQLEEERLKKMKERQELKKLTPQALFHYNKDKAKVREDTSINKIDDSEAKVGFSEALKYTEKTAKLHHALVEGKIKEPGKIAKKVDDIRSKVVKQDKRDPLEKYKKQSASEEQKKQKKEKIIVDRSGTVDGEEVTGLVRTEMKKVKKKKNEVPTDAQDDFVLGKLFEKKGKTLHFFQEKIVCVKYVCD